MPSRDSDRETLRSALELLGRSRLREITNAHDLPVADRRVLAHHVDALLGAPALAEILEDMKRDELKAMCHAVGLDDSGRAKRPLVERLLGDASSATSGETSPPPPSAAPSAAVPAAVSSAAPGKGLPGGAWALPAPPDQSGDLEKRLWDAADELRANSKLKASEYSTPVLGLIFLRYADDRFAAAHQEISARSGRRLSTGPQRYHARGVVYLPESARFRTLLELPEGEDLGRALNEAMRAIEEDNEKLRGVLPKSYQRIESRTLVELLKVMASIPMDGEGDAFGRIYEYFLGKFAMSEGQKGGEFFTPTSIVRLIVEILEPFHGRIYDPACGSGGMFVQSARFVKEHRARPEEEISIYGEERVDETVRLCRMNLAVHGLEGLVSEGNTYYEDLHGSVDSKGEGIFDFVMANPPFNVDRVDKERLKSDRRFPFGMPKPDNANYLWIQMFYSALRPTGRAGFVMANSASDARGSEMEIRRRLIEDRAVDVVVSVASNFFYTVTLPCTLWFFDRGKKGTDRRDRVLFLDARHIYRQLDRAHRDFAPEQLEFLANVVRLYRGEAVEDRAGSSEMLGVVFPDGVYGDVAGLCRVATVGEIEGQGWSLNPGRYVGVAEREVEEFDFFERLEELNEELEVLNVEGRELEERIAENVIELLEAGP